MVQPVSSVTIVGAGSAGWLSALVLNTYCPFLKVRLIRPRAGTPIGVGESTQGDLLRTLTAARIDLQAFYKACNATMKCGIYYEDWNSVGSHYWHPFTGMANTGFYTAAHHYQQMMLRHPERYSAADYYPRVHPSYDICVKQKQVAPESAIAFHIDAYKLTTFLESVLPGVEVLEADNVDIRSADGRISEILIDGRSVSADLYIDCTGFSRAVFNKVATPDIMPYEANVNRAVAAQLPYLDAAAEVAPYTKAHAHEHGWTWSIPLQTRMGTGYVYHADFCSPEEAERNFRAYWGEQMRDINVAHIDFDKPTLRNPWAKNVVSIGLSAGFVEPLEATGLTWTITSAYVLCQSLSPRYYDEETSTRYNALMRGFIYDVMDFVDAHYKLSARRDTEFWRYHTSRDYPDRLDFRLDLYAREMPTAANRLRAFILAFNEVSWIDILNGYQFPYEKQNIHPSNLEAGEQALRALASQPRRGVPPLQCQPPSEPPQALQAQSSVAART
jgi:2-polyprenyl-6-methoxyphenol hydroxylase-like FAD-dependent oxidoreductase